MSKITANTDVIRQCAQQIAQTNANMLNEVSTLETSVTSMNCACTSTAVDRAVGAMREMKNLYSIPLHDKITQFTNLLQSQVATGYEITETAITTLADAFN